MRPILPNGTELPEGGDDIKAIGILKSSSGNHTHIHGIPRSGADGFCVKLGTFRDYSESDECDPCEFTDFSDLSEEDDFEHDFDHDQKPNVTNIEFSVDDELTNEELFSMVFEPSIGEDAATESSTKSTEARRSPNKTTSLPPSSHVSIIRYILDLITGVDSTTVVAESENIYKETINHLGKENVEEQLRSALQPDIAAVYMTGPLTLDVLVALDHSKAEQYPWPGSYLHVVYDESQPGVYWLYVDTAINVQARIAQHHKFRHTPSRQSLHYSIWNAPGRKDFFILLGGFKDIEESFRTAMLNLFEHWNCSIWQTLPRSLLARSLPEDIPIFEPNIHLNRASALRQKYSTNNEIAGNIEAALELSEGAADLRLSKDPEIRDYFERREKYFDLALYRNLERLKLGRAVQRDTNYKSLTYGIRKRSNFDPDGLTREANQNMGDETQVWIRCARCRHPETLRIDPAPLYEKATGFYVRRLLSCKTCATLTGIHGRYLESQDHCPTEPLDPRILENSVKYGTVMRHRRG